MKTTRVINFTDIAINRAAARSTQAAIKPAIYKKERRSLAASERSASGVDPFRSQQDFNATADYLRTHGPNRQRNYMLIILGTTLGLRCGDLLRLKIRDVWDSEVHMPRNYINICEEKTGKNTRNKLTDTAKLAIRDYIESLPGFRTCDPLFVSQKRNEDGTKRALDISQVWRILNKAAKTVGVEDNIGTHSMRKTYGYSANRAMAEAGLPSSIIMETLQAKFHHSSQTITARYIGLEQDNIDQVANIVDNWISGAGV